MSWHRVCRRDVLQPERGVAALINGVQVAIIVTFDEVVHAIGNIDPYTGSAVLSRGIVGTRGGVATIASPLHKQAFNLHTGASLVDPDTCVPVYPARVLDGYIEIDVEPAEEGA